MNAFKLMPEACSAGSFKGYTKLDAINLAAKRNSGAVFNNLLHHINHQNLLQAFRQCDGNKAVGVDQVTKAKYRENLAGNIEKLAEEIYRGGWRPRPSREVLIPKAQGGFRPLAIGCLEDKIVQKVMAKILEAVFDPTFASESYGFRSGKTAHEALSALYKKVDERSDSAVVVEMDIEKFFNTMDHELLMEFIQKRISDHHILRLIRRMLRNSTLSETGELIDNITGAPQGSPVSPVLANIYLHYLLDKWFREEWGSKGHMVRYADDAVFIFTSKEDAAEFQIALKERLEQKGKLRLNEEKSGLISFNTKLAENELPFLGFHLYWGRLITGRRILKCKTAPKRIANSIQKFKEWIKSIRHRKPLDTIWDLVKAKLRGHYQYYGVSFNGAKLNYYYYTVVGLTFRWLNRRSQKRSFTPERFARRLMFKPLPKPIRGAALLDITRTTGTKLKHKPRSRMRELRKYGSNRSGGWQHPLFT